MKIADFYYKIRKKLGLEAMSSSSLKTASVLYPMELPETVVRRQDELLLKRLLLTLIAGAVLFAASLLSGNKNAAIAVPVLSLIAIIGQVALEYEHRKEKLENRRRQLELDYSKLASDFAILTGAGLSVKHAWEKITADYQEDLKRGKRPGYLCEEMLFSLRQMERGVPETEAYYRFAERTGITSYLRFVRLLELSRKNGRTEFARTLNEEAFEASSKRLLTARRMGERIQIKLLIPMMILFALVLAILIIPAFLSW